MNTSGGAASRTDSTWTSRRRLLTALACGIPDRVPVSTYELVGYNSAAWENREPSYRSLMDDIRARSDCIAMWNCGTQERLISSAGSILCSAFPVPVDRREERFGQRVRTTEVMHTPKGDLRRVLEHEPSVYTTWVTEHWCKSVDDVERALSVPYEPPVFTAADYPRIQAELGEHGILMPSLGDPAYAVADLMSFQDFTLWAFEEPEHFDRCVRIVAERVMENLRRELDACVADLYRICGPEYFTPPYLPPATFARWIVPHVTAMTRLIHERGGKVRFHCHGKIGQVLDMILETEPDGLDPCEPPPDGDIGLAEVKRRCAARKVCVFGNMELKVLEHGSTAQVRATVKAAMNAAKEGGGFVLMPTAAPINVPLAAKTEENYRAYIDAALEYGRYE